MQQYTRDQVYEFLNTFLYDQGFRFRDPKDKIFGLLDAKYPPPSSHQGEVSNDAHEKEIMIKAFAKVEKAFEKRSWIMEGRGPYEYNDDEYKKEVTYLYEEFEAIKRDTWDNIKSKSFEYRKAIIAEYLSSQPAPPTPVDTDFEAAIEAQLERLPHFYPHTETFAEGARWARQHLASIPETAGPWHLRSHNNSEDDDTVWMTDGKLSIYIDEFNFDDFPEADYWLVNFLNKYQFKLSFDDQSPLIISHLEEQVKELHRMITPSKDEHRDQIEANQMSGMPIYEAEFQAGYSAGVDFAMAKLEKSSQELQGRNGLIWVKASEKVPDHFGHWNTGKYGGNNSFPIRLDGKKLCLANIYNEQESGDSPDIWVIKIVAGEELFADQFHRIEYLYDSPAPATEQSDYQKGFEAGALFQLRRAEPAADKEAIEIIRGAAKVVTKDIELIAYGRNDPAPEQVDVDPNPLTKDALRIELWSMLTDDARKAMMPLKDSYLDSVMADIESYCSGIKNK